MKTILGVTVSLQNLENMESKKESSKYLRLNPEKPKDTSIIFEDPKAEKFIGEIKNKMKKTDSEEVEVTLTIDKTDQEKEYLYSSHSII